MMKKEGAQELMLHEQVDNNHLMVVSLALTC